MAHTGVMVKGISPTKQIRKQLVDPYGSTFRISPLGQYNLSSSVLISLSKNKKFN